MNPPITTCAFCRQSLASSEEAEAHEAACSLRQWWIENFGGKRIPERAPAPTDLVSCQFCGYQFDKPELEEHQARCGARKWVMLNFEPQRAKRPAPREAPLQIPETPSAPPGLVGLFKKVVGKVKGPDPRFARLQDAFRHINQIRDDETFAVCRKAMVAVQDVLTELGERVAGDPAPAKSTPMPMLVGTAEKLADAAAALEAELDDLFHRAPMKIQRELGYLEDAAGQGAKVDELRQQLAACDALQTRITERRVQVREVAARLEALRHRFVGTEEGAAPSIDRLEASMEVIERRLEATPAPLLAAMDTKIVDDHTTPYQRPGTPPAVALDRETFERLQPQGRGFSSVASIGHYRIIGLLGTGGMGVVYEARAPDGSRVALKTMRIAKGSDVDDRFERRFRRECRILQQVDHPGCVRMLDLGRHGDELFFVMEQVEGVPLSALLRERRLTLEEAVGLGLDLCEPLIYLHESKIVHRDLKPDNVMLKRDGRAVITDFGISRVTDATEITEAGGLIGTPGYVSPEVVLGAPVTAAADQWSLGKILFESVSAAPTAGSEPGSFRERVAAGTLVDWSRFPATRDWAALRAAIERMLAHAPEDRFEGAVEVKIGLSVVREGSGARLPVGVARVL